MYFITLIDQLYEKIIWIGSIVISDVSHCLPNIARCRVSFTKLSYVTPGGHQELGSYIRQPFPMQIAQNCSGCYLW